MKTNNVIIYYSKLGIAKKTKKLYLCAQQQIIKIIPNENTIFTKLNNVQSYSKVLGVRTVRWVPRFAVAWLPRIPIYATAYYVKRKKQKESLGPDLFASSAFISTSLLQIICILV